MAVVYGAELSLAVVNAPDPATVDTGLPTLDDDAWIIFTSGSTGKPAFMDKAIKVASRNVLPKATVLRLESDQFGIVASGLSNREDRALAMRISSC